MLTENTDGNMIDPIGQYDGNIASVCFVPSQTDNRLWTVTDLIRPFTKRLLRGNVALQIGKRILSRLDRFHFQAFIKPLIDKSQTFDRPRAFCRFLKALPDNALFEVSEKNVKTKHVRSVFFKDIRQQSFFVRHRIFRIRLVFLITRYAAVTRSVLIQIVCAVKLRVRQKTQCQRYFPG